MALYKYSSKDKASNQVKCTYGRKIKTREVYAEGC